MMITDIDKSIRDSTVLARIGNTPLLRLDRIGRDKLASGVEILAKAEWYNPGGSVKDRSALNMVLEGERSGKLTKEKIIVDATSGNTGIAYALIGALLGYRVHLAIPANASMERKRILAAYGAQVTYTNPLEGTDGAQLYVKRLVSEHPEKYFYPDQYNNPANWEAHYNTTGAEIIKQTDGRLTHFVAGLGTTGTFVGTARRLRKFNPMIKCISVQPDSPLHALEGLKHMESAIVPRIYDGTIADENMEVSTEEAHKMMKLLARDQGLLVGVSSAAAMVATLRVAGRLKEGVLVTIFSDNGTKYLNDPLWEN